VSLKKTVGWNLQMALNRFGAALLLGAWLFAASPVWPQSQPVAGWLPPGLTEEERREWKDGRPPGWSRGLKRGWRGKGCPPGLAKKGRCQPRHIAGASQSEQQKWERQLRDAIERLKKWGRDKLKLPAPLLDAVLIGFEGAVRHGVTIASGERVVTAAAERGLSPYGVEAITRALAYSADRGAPIEELEAFVQQGLSRGVAADALATGVYRLGAEAKP